MTKPILKKVESETALLEKISLLIPGFRGYKKKELRREADRLVRDNVYVRLTAAKSGLREVFQALAKAKLGGELAAADKLIAKFDRVVELVHHAPHGYAGFFDAIKIREDDLERMLDFDLDLVESAKEIEAKVKQLRQDVSGSKYEKVGSHLGAVTGMIESLESAFEGRKEVVMGVEL